MGTAFKWTFYPILGVALLSLLGVIGEGIYFAWFGALAYGALALMVGAIALLGSVFDRDGNTGQVAAGILGGVAVGVVVLAVTCFINLGSI